MPAVPERHRKIISLSINPFAACGGIFFAPFHIGVNGAIKKAHTKCVSFFCGDPVGIRTLDLLIRSQSLYPAELPSHVGMKIELHSVFCGRGRRNRTLNQWFWRPLLYQLSYTPTKISGFLSSQGASPQVLSAFAALTAVFGMGTGGSPQLSPLNLCFRIRILTTA